MMESGLIDLLLSIRKSVCIVLVLTRFRVSQAPITPGKNSGASCSA